MTIPMRPWLIGVATLVGIGMLRVAQQTAMWQAAYRVGAEAERLHALENDTAWLRTEVLSLHSPSRLAGVMHARRDQDKLVAWSELPKEPPAPAQGLRGGPGARVRVAQAEPSDP